MIFMEKGKASKISNSTLYKMKVQAYGNQMK